MNKSMEKSNLGNKETVLSEQSAAFVQYLMERGYLSDKNIDDEQIREAKKKTAARTYHNTLLLLDNYRTISWMVECIPDSIAEELNIPVRDLDILLERVDLELSMENKKLESRLYSASKTRILLERVNKAISMLRMKPENGEEMYQVIYRTYVAPPAACIEDIYSELNISRRKYYKIRKQAIVLISLSLWSAPAAEVDKWMEVVYMLEDINRADGFMG